MYALRSRVQHLSALTKLTPSEVQCWRLIVSAFAEGREDRPHAGDR
jgi:hypothetical protein